MTSPLVSCILPVYNGAAHLRDALESVLAQQYAPTEIVAVDDGSTDGSPGILAACGSRVRVIRQPNGGPAAARNAGIHAARGELIAFLDQDDRWHPRKLARQVAHLQANPQLDVVVAHVESFWEGEAPRAADQPRAGAVPGYVTSSMLARRGVFERVGLFDPRLWFVDSLDWFVRARERDVGIDLIPDVLLYHRVHAGNLSRRGRDSRAECLRIVKSALDRRRDARAGDPMTP